MALATIVGIGLSLIFKLISMLRPEEVVLDAEDADNRQIMYRPGSVAARFKHHGILW